MASKRVRRLPASVHLPSGRRVRLSDAAALRAKEHARSAAKQGGSGPFAEALLVLSGEGTLATEGGDALDVLSLSVRDVHVLRALVTWAGLVDEEAEGFTCENCDAPFEIAPSEAMEIGPFVDGELSDPELDAPFPFGRALAIPRIALPSVRTPQRRGGRIVARSVRSSGPRSAETITFVERTGEEARALFTIADGLISGRSRSLRVTPAVVIGMGVAALGVERRASVIADALMDASNAAWAKVLDHWHDAAYPRRLFAVHRCAKCGARNDLDVPLARELLRESPSFTRARSSARPPFPSLDAFEATVRTHADRIYAEKGVRNVDLFVDADVPHVDEGGEPLLGSYLAGGVDEDTGVPRAPEIRLYYRTFKSEAQADPDFDVEGEIIETIDHELTHHLHHLTGVDPLDDEEHAEIDREEARRVGSRELARRERRAALSSVTGFLRTTWPLWVAVVIAAIILAYSQS